MLELNQESIPAFINKPFALLYMYTPKCPHCQSFAPVMDAISKIVPEVQIGKVNIFEAEDFAVSLGLDGVPYIAIMQNGEHVGGGNTNNAYAILDLIKYLKVNSV